MEEFKSVDSGMGYEGSVWSEEPAAVKTKEYEESVGVKARKLSGRILSVLVLKVERWRDRGKERGYVEQSLVSTPSVSSRVRRKRNLVGEFGQGLRVSQTVATRTNLLVNSQPTPNNDPTPHYFPIGIGDYGGNCPEDGDGAYGVQAVGWNDAGALWGTGTMPS